MIGKVVLSKIWFTDLSQYKIRPILILKQYDNEDFLFLPLIGNRDRKGILLQKSDILKGDLKKDSVIIIQKISICHKSLIHKEIATLKGDFLKKVQQNLCMELGCLKGE